MSRSKKTYDQDQLDQLSMQEHLMVCIEDLDEVSLEAKYFLKNPPSAGHWRWTKIQLMGYEGERLMFNHPEFGPTCMNGRLDEIYMIP